jgi:hypothetical protein
VCEHLGWHTASGSNNEYLRRYHYLGYVVGNGRFLIFPWVRVKNLASHALGKVVRVLGQDWPRV